MPSDDPNLRASDDDRDRTASLLREHHAAGRLTPDEFQERLDATFEAKTLGQLQELLADLPAIDLYHLPEQSMRRSQHEPASHPAVPEHSRLSPAWRHHWASWASTSLVLFVIWLITAVSSHSMNGLWFLWVAGPWGAILAARWLFGQHPDGPHGPHGAVGGPSGGPPRELAEPADSQLPDAELRDRLDQHRQRMEDHMQRRQEQMEEQMQRRQEHMQRRQDRMQRRQDGMPPPREY
jgi:hypothetical protein